MLGAGEQDFARYDVGAAGPYDLPLARALGDHGHAAAADLGHRAVAAVGGDERGRALGRAWRSPPRRRCGARPWRSWTSERTAVPLGRAARAAGGLRRPAVLASSARRRDLLERLGLARLALPAHGEDAWPEARLPAGSCFPASWGRWPLTAAVTETSPARVSSVDPIGTAATPFSDTNPLLWNGTRSPLVNALAGRACRTSFTNTSPETSLPSRPCPASTGVVPEGQHLARVADAVGVAVALASVGRVGAVVRAVGLSPSPSRSVTVSAFGRR